jgi:hypothetical protein
MNDALKYFRCKLESGMSTELGDASSSMLKSKKFKELLQHSTDTMAIGAAEVWLQERLKTFVQLSGHPGGLWVMNADLRA